MRPPPRCAHHFKSDLINNMDHTRTSGTEPPPAIASQTKQFQKLKIDNPKVPKPAESKRDFNKSKLKYDEDRQKYISFKQLAGNLNPFL